MKEILLSTIVLLFVIQCYAQPKNNLPRENKVKKTTVTEYGVDENGRSGIIKRSTLLPKGRRGSLNPNKNVEPLATTHSSTATFSKATKIPKSIPDKSVERTIEGQINKIELEITKYKDRKSEEDQLRLQKLEQLLEKKKIEKVISQ